MLGKHLSEKTKSKSQRHIAQELINCKAQRKASKGFQFHQDGYLQNELEASFIYEDTPDQFTATQDVKADMQNLTQWIGWSVETSVSAKTEVAIRAAFKAVVSGKQVAVLVPTTILALQHYKTFHDRLKEFGVTVGLCQ